MTGADVKNGASLSDAFKQAGADIGGLQTFLENSPQYGDAFRAALDKAVKSRVAQEIEANPELNAADATTRASQELAPEMAAAMASTIPVHPAAVRGMRAFGDLAEASNSTSKQGPLLTALDRFNSLWKTLQYHVWPSSHIRDIGTRVMNSALDGRASLLDIINGTMDAVKYMRNPEAASDELREAAERFRDLDVLRPYQHMNMEAAGIPGAAEEALPWRKRLLRVPGLISKEEVAKGNLNPLVALGYRAQYAGDFAGQFGHYLALAKAGYSDRQIAQIIRETHYVGDLSPFEKNVLSRVIPFERFTVRNIPHQIKAAFSEPGGRTAQMMRFLTEGSARNNGDVYVPGWMRENTVYPSGRNEQGEQGYYRNTLAPQQELNEIVLGRGLVGDIARTGEKLAAKASPLALLPLERPWSDKGTQLETGRKMSELQSPLSNFASQYAGAPVNIGWLDSILHYSPVARIASEGERIPHIESLISHLPGAAPSDAVSHGTVPQFLMDMLGIGKTSYYDDRLWRAIDARHALESQAERFGAKPLTGVELPKGVAQHMTPEEIEYVHELLRRRKRLTEWMTGRSKQQEQRLSEPSSLAQPTL